MFFDAKIMERGVRTTKGGGEQDGLYIKGDQLNADGSIKQADTYRFLSNQYDSQYISEAEKVGAGNKLEIKLVRENGYWNIKGIQAWDGPGTGAGAGNAGGSSTGNVSGKSYLPAKGEFRKPEQLIRGEALNQALKFADMLVAFQIQAEKAKVLDPGKLTAALLKDEVMSFAADFEKFITGEKGVANESSAKDLQAPPPGAEGAGGNIPEDDIPF